MPADQAALWAFCNELQQQRQVSDATWAAALQQPGEAGVVDLLGLCGDYTQLTMVMNAPRPRVPAGLGAPW